MSDAAMVKRVTVAPFPWPNGKGEYVAQPAHKRTASVTGSHRVPAFLATGKYMGGKDGQVAIYMNAGVSRAGLSFGLFMHDHGATTIQIVSVS